MPNFKKNPNAMKPSGFKMKYQGERSAFPFKFQSTISGKPLKSGPAPERKKRKPKYLKDTKVGKAITDITGSIFGSRKNPKYKGKGRSLLGSLTHSRRKFKAKQGKPTKSDGFGTAIGGQKGVDVVARGYTTKKPRGGAKYSDEIKLDKKKSFFG